MTKPPLITILTEPIGSIPRPDGLIDLALSRFSPKERRRIGVHTCPGSNLDSTHSADVDYAELLPSLFALKVDSFYIALAGERDRRHALKIIREYGKPNQRIFVGVIAPIDRYIEAPEEVRVRSFAAWQPDGGAWLP